ncbi:WD40 repeat domain-containing protein [Pasteurella atlantica]|uniref:WD40 repeat domain-containing protein n=2 Tax=Pasteurellaceae TaxID=712 RepID=A0ACC6HPS0_9PAST|nr:WD40 repeat domain-containing protein [Pasteurella atlantica]MDP8052809.1 WD40 repeat domain-containing protein [Pasteurella atlantica]MDP8105756.1 WD40 repeat domain-containing protein [Pasteurella atlantica]MDP8149500.1 WD40 repeat domain-containing protein [Pasteurella atlantica]
MKKFIKKHPIISTIILFVIGYNFVYFPLKKVMRELFFLPPVMSTGVSTDGCYVITAHAWRDMNRNFDNNPLVLWDIKNKSKQIIAEKVNPFSAYFIPDSHEFMWQDNKDVVHIQNIEGKETLSFKHPRTQGHLMSADKKTYISATPDWWIYSGYGKDRKLVLNDDFGSPQPLNLSLAGNYFLTAGSGIGSVKPIVDTDFKDKPVIDTGKIPAKFHSSITLWDKNTLQPVTRIRRHNGKIFALFSPDGKWLISGDETGFNYMWSMDNLENRLQLATPLSGIFIQGKNGEPHYWDESQLLALPSKFKSRLIMHFTVAYAFLTEKDFIHLGHAYGTKNEDSVVPLYTVGDPWIKGYLDLQATPRPSLDYYSKSLTVASSYKAHVLVIGQAYKGGISVYQYHPDKKELERIWVGDDRKYW